MTLIDLILNIVGLLLWLTWRSARVDLLPVSAPATLAGTLKRTDTRPWKSWHGLAVLAGLLMFRGLIYWQIGAAVDWNPSLELGVISVSFRSDFFGRIQLFSLLSFGSTLVVFYLWLLCLSLANGSMEADMIQRWIDRHLGWLGRTHWTVKLLLPLCLITGLWFVLGWVFGRLRITPPALSYLHRLQQGGLIAMSACLTCKYVVGAVLLVWLVSSYVYFGDHPVWKFVAMTGRRLVVPLRWLPLQIGKVDFAPVVMLAAVFFTAELAERGLTALYQRIPV